MSSRILQIYTILQQTDSVAHSLSTHAWLQRLNATAETRLRRQRRRYTHTHTHTESPENCDDAKFLLRSTIAALRNSV